MDEFEDIMNKQEESLSSWLWDRRAWWLYPFIIMSVIFFIIMFIFYNVNGGL